MRKFSRLVIRRRKLIMGLTVLLCVVSLIGMMKVSVNYDMASYLPDDSPTTAALNMVGADSPNIKIYVPDTPLTQAPVVKEKLLQSPHVLDVLWLDDVFDLRGIPEEMIPEATLSPWYHQGGALFQATIDPGNYVLGFNEVKALYPDSITAGNAANQARVISVSMKEVAKIIPFVLPIVLLILFISTRHWFEPVLFLSAIGVAILINEGTNYFIGSVSFVTRASSAVLQLAVSIDYAVFLLHRFGEYREKGMGIEDAMVEAMVQSASSIAASAMTTVFGFLALMLMDFKIGQDMGSVLAKGVFISYLSVIIFLPAMAITFHKTIDRTAHRSFMPSFGRFSRIVVRYAAPLAVLLLVLLVPTYMGQGANTFMYGSSGMHAEASPVRQEALKIDEMFGRSQQMMLMVPQGDLARVKALGAEIEKVPDVTAVISYANSVGLGIPPEVLPGESLKQLRDKGYDRLIIAADTPEEGEQAFRVVESIRALTEEFYGKDYYFAGENVANYDMRDTIVGDSGKVLWGSILSIGLVLLLTFRSLTIPLVLLLVIEGAIWINLSIPYFQGADLNYIGYQIVSSVQLGATVDYGILLTQRYMEARREMDRKDAARFALTVSTGSILPPALILTAAGLLMGLVSTNGVISQLGLILGRGAAISAGMVLLVLPHVLIACDGLIRKTTLQRKEEKFV